MEKIGLLVLLSVFPKTLNFNWIRRVLHHSGEKKYDESSPPPPHLDQLVCVMLMYVLDNVFVTIYFIYVSVTSSAKEALISSKWWVYGDFCQQKYMFSSRVTHTHSYITHEPINTSEWVHMCTLCTCIQTQTVQITCYVSVLSLICSSGFGWFVFSCTAHQPHSFSTAHTCSSVSNLPLLPLVLASLFHLPPLFIRRGMCDMWISRQGVWYPCWALERRPNKEEVVKNNPAATSIHAPFITSLSLISQLLCAI